VLAVDASLSMLATDERPSRLERVKQEIRRLRALSPGDRVTLTVGEKSTEVSYEKPADCAPALPVTGANAGLLAGAALVLVSGGAGLYFVARRRRIRFAA